jgi:uncharacterized protein YbaA (DUF1428 family)
MIVEIYPINFRFDEIHVLKNIFRNPSSNLILLEALEAIRYRLSNLNNATGIASPMNRTNPTKENERGSYLQVSFCRVPKKNHDAIIQNGKKNDQLWKKHGTLRTESFQLGDTEIPGCDSISRTLSASQDEEIWVLLQFFKDENHWAEVMANMMQDESVGPMVKEFEALTQGKRIVTGGFIRLPV